MPPRADPSLTRAHSRGVSLISLTTMISCSEDMDNPAVCASSPCCGLPGAQGAAQMGLGSLARGWELLTVVQSFFRELRVALSFLSEGKGLSGAAVRSKKEPPNCLPVAEGCLCLFRVLFVVTVSCFVLLECSSGHLRISAVLLKDALQGCPGFPG